MEQENNKPESKMESKIEKEENTQKKGNYKSYDNSPFAPYERSQLYQEDFINDRVEQRIRMQEKAAEKFDQGITNKDKFITKKGKEQFYFYGDRVDYNIKKTKDKYDLIQKKNEGYKITKEQEDKYFKNYVDNVKPTTPDQIDQEFFESEGKRLNKQIQYNKDLNEQINNTKAMRNKFEKDYNQRLIDAKKLDDERYFKEEKKKEEKRLQYKNDFRNINEKIIAEKNEAKLMNQKQNVEYDNVINIQIRKQMDYMEEKEYRRKEDKKNRYKQALDKQIDQQKIRKQREYDIEHGNF